MATYTCSYDKCDNKYEAPPSAGRKFCSPTCYSNSKRKPRGLVLVEKHCTKCSQIKPVAEFGKNAQSWDGLTNNCKQCRNDAAKPRRSPAYQRFYQYGLTEQQFVQMIRKQNNRCAVCDKEFNVTRKIQVDHCHSSGKVRGLLCPPCNKGLGFFQDNPERLRKAIAYVGKKPERKSLRKKS